MASEGLSILDALENLNALVEADSLDEIEVTENAQLIAHKEREDEFGRQIYWVKAGADDQTLEAIKETFRVVHKYLHSFYTRMKKQGDTQELVEGINTIMVLVGEAAKKLDRFGTLFREKITEFDEYRNLQNFYRNKVIKESYREFAHTPIPREKPLTEEEKWEAELAELLGGDEVEEVAGVHILNDIEVIKRDHLYELFYLRNEAGHNFYSYELARNLKLACDFGEYSEEYFGDDPLLQIKNWEDKGLHIFAKRLLKSSSQLIDKFYKEALQYREMDMIASLHKAVMALMLASNPRNLIRQFALKGSHRYFLDFQLFLREALSSREYQKFLIYSPPEAKPFFVLVFDLVNRLCFDLFTLGVSQEELKAALAQQVKQFDPHKTKTLSAALKNAYEALAEALKRHPSGPIFKAVDLVRDEGPRSFDPWIQGNLPGPEALLNMSGRDVALLRLPAPITQEYIHHALVTEEFKNFLRAYKFFREGRFLIVNYQDRTSWKEHVRCLVLEDLANQAEFAEVLTLVTMAKDTDFYHQGGVYHELTGARDFINQFSEHISDESAGYHFPARLRKVLFAGWFDALLGQIHKTFFSGKKSLTLRERHDFIEIAYHFLELKLIEHDQPDAMALMSKDSLDIGGTSSVGLIALLGMGKKWTEEEKEEMCTTLFGPTLMNRERVVQPERFDRLHHMIVLLEESGDYLKDFRELFNKETLAITPSFKTD